MVRWWWKTDLQRYQRRGHWRRSIEKAGETCSRASSLTSSFGSHHPRRTDGMKMHAGWMIRYHRKTRKRAFHPLHRGKGAPTPTDLIPYRMTVQFNSQGESKFWLGQWIGQTWSSPGYLGWVFGIQALGWCERCWRWTTWRWWSSTANYGRPCFKQSFKGIHVDELYGGFTGTWVQCPWKWSPKSWTSGDGICDNDITAANCSDSFNRARLEPDSSRKLRYHDIDLMMLRAMTALSWSKMRTVKFREMRSWCQGRDTCILKVSMELWLCHCRAYLEEEMGMTRNEVDHLLCQRYRIRRRRTQNLQPLLFSETVLN